MENEKLNNQKSPEILDLLEVRLNTEVADFFETEILKPNIETFDSKADLDKQYSENSNCEITDVPDWLVAFATKKTDNIYILSPDAMPAGKEVDGYARFTKTLKHEIGHLYTKNLNNQIPSWLNEGVSLYLADQNHYKMINHEKISMELLNKLENTHNDPAIYQVGYTMAVELVKLGGKNLLLEVAAFEEKSDRDIALMEIFPWLK